MRATQRAIIALNQSIGAAMRSGRLPSVDSETSTVVFPLAPRSGDRRSGISIASGETNSYGRIEILPISPNHDVEYPSIPRYEMLESMTNFQTSGTTNNTTTNSSVQIEEQSTSSSQSDDSSMRPGQLQSLTEQTKAMESKIREEENDIELLKKKLIEHAKRINVLRANIKNDFNPDEDLQLEHSISNYDKAMLDLSKSKQHLKRQRNIHNSFVKLGKIIENNNKIFRRRL